MDSVTCAAEEAILSFQLGGGCQSPSFMFPPACSSFMAKQCFQEKSFLFWELLVAVQWVATILQCREMCPCCSRPWWKGIICPLCLSDQAFSFDTTCPISSTEYPGGCVSVREELGWHSGGSLQGLTLKFAVFAEKESYFYFVSVFVRGG